MPLSKERMRERKKVDRMSNPTPINVKPNRYLAAHLKVCPDYNVKNPGDHFNHCPYVNPMLRDDPVIPKYPLGYQYPDGSCRLPDMTLVTPGECEIVRIYRKPGVKR